MNTVKQIKQCKKETVNKYLVKPSTRKIKNKKIGINGYLFWGCLILIILIGSVITGSIFYNVDPNVIDPANRLEGFGTQSHLLGTDHLGRDMLARIIAGTRLTLLSSTISAMVAVALGIIIGLFAGMSKKTVDIIVMRFIDLLQSFPSILLAILIVAFIGPGLRNSMIAITIVNIPFYAVLTRSVTLSVKEKDFVKASHAIGNSQIYTALRHVLPNISTYIVSQMMMQVGWMMTSLTSLSFLGLGVQPPTAELGNILSELKTIIMLKPQLVMAPGLVIILAAAGFNLLGEGLKEHFDPKK